MGDESGDRFCIVCETTHLGSCHYSRGFEVFPFDDETTRVYASHQRVRAYLKSYASHFGLTPHSLLGARVRCARPDKDGSMIEIDGEAEPQRYCGLVVASGDHDEPRVPTVLGAFAAKLMRAREYKSPSQLVGKLVRVVGARNSGCDIDRDGVPLASRIAISIRRG